MRGEASGFTWWLLKTATRRYVRERTRGTPDENRWKYIYVGINSGARNGADEKHLAYIDRYVTKEAK